MDNGQIEKLKQQWEAERKRDACCPNCGRCPTCGRSNAQQFVPVHPVPTWPRYPYYWGTAPAMPWGQLRREDMGGRVQHDGADDICV